MAQHTKKLFEKTVEAPAKALEKVVKNSHETIDFLAAKKPIKKAKNYWRILGPGLTTGASDDDPSGIATYSQAGARYGFQLLWLAPFTFPLMGVVQEMCARIGLVTGQGLAANIRKHFPRWVLYACTALLFSANTFNVGADLGAMAKAVQLLYPATDFALLVFGFTVFSLLLQVFSTYERYAKYLKYLALILFSYVLSALLIKDLDWQAIIFAGLTPSIEFSKDQLLMICAVLGTTISPYLFFWQTSQEVEDEILKGKKKINQRLGASKHEISDMRADVWSGMFLSNAIMFFIIVACGATLHASGITTIESAADAAEALRPLAGEATYILFTLGIIGTGLLAVPVLAGSAAYAVSEAFQWKNGLHHKLKHAYAFYGILIISMGVGLQLNFVGLDPIKALIYSAVANGIIAPVALVLILLLSNSEKIMGKWANSPLIKTVGWAVVGIMTIVSITTAGSIFF